MGQIGQNMDKILGLLQRSLSRDAFKWMLLRAHQQISTTAPYKDRPDVQLRYWMNVLVNWLRWTGLGGRGISPRTEAHLQHAASDPDCTEWTRKLSELIMNHMDMENEDWPQV